MEKEQQIFCMTRYGQKPPFASFLPGIAGIKGIPIWCYYVNRGQGVVSFGVNDKDHAIMEFLPAHRAYASVRRTGFRTFLRRDGRFVEPFSREGLGRMEIGMNTLRLEENDPNSALRTQVDYFVLPEERLGALVRRVKITNTGKSRCRLEVLDGMPELIPYGVPDVKIKNVLQTAKAWMQVEGVKTRTPYYRVRVSIVDAAKVSAVEGGNFALGFDEAGKLLPVTADMNTVFSYDTSLEKPQVFILEGLTGVLSRKQVSSNFFPGAFFALERELAPGESAAFTEVIGQAERRELLDEFLLKSRNSAYFDAKFVRAQELTRELTDSIDTHTGNETFDAYCRYTYMDNVLRGGQPIRLGKDKVFHVYSRKHGDLERDYNYFSMLPEFFSQGNGNFRDVNQNRRNDTFFAPFVGRESIRTFYSLIQLDGYNPLSVEMKTYSISAEKAEEITKYLPEDVREKLLPQLAEPFTPGRLYEMLMPLTDNTDGLFARLIDGSDSRLNARFGEGYWSDHWTYNLDLIEEYLAVFPEREREMLYEPEYSWFLSQVRIAPRARRYAETENGIRQYHPLDESSRRTTEQIYLHDAQGQPVRSTLLEKLTLMCAAKFAALDPCGMGVEMEGGKPGWYDALNGLPGLLGSSMCETYELARMLNYTVSALERWSGSVGLLEEISDFLEELCRVNSAHRDSIRTQVELPDFWNAVNDRKEAYWRRVYAGVSGRRVSYGADQLAGLLSGLAETVQLGIDKALSFGVAGDTPNASVCPAYFAYDVTDYTKDADGIHPRHFSLVRIPAFLEGPVRWLKLPVPMPEKRAMYERVRMSDLYDQKLSMYRVNASLQNATYELGRARAFTPGWLENGSIWLHMEYKYLLELLRCGLYEEFFRDFRAASVPFLEPEQYGRSTLENSSFLASSVNPDESIHGRGFVARLSGSTAEFLSIWRRMLFGEKPFVAEQGELVCRLQPAIPAYLIGGDRTIRGVFLGQTQVTYHLDRLVDYIPGGYRLELLNISYGNGVRVLAGSTLRGTLAQDLRDGTITSLEAVLYRN